MSGVFRLTHIFNTFFPRRKTVFNCDLYRWRIAAAATQWSASSALPPFSAVTQFVQRASARGARGAARRAVDRGVERRASASLRSYRRRRRRCFSTCQVEIHLPAVFLPSVQNLREGSARPRTCKSPSRALSSSCFCISRASPLVRLLAHAVHRDSDDLCPCQLRRLRPRDWIRRYKGGYRATHTRSRAHPCIHHDA